MDRCRLQTNLISTQAYCLVFAQIWVETERKKNPNLGKKDYLNHLSVFVMILQNFLTWKTKRNCQFLLNDNCSLLAKLINTHL